MKKGEAMIILLSVFWFAFRQRRIYLQKLHSGKARAANMTLLFYRYLVIFFILSWGCTLFGMPGIENELRWSQAEIRSIVNGNWSNPATWNAGRLPDAGDNVIIEKGHTVTYDIVSEKAIRSIHIRGALVFSDQVNSQLDVGMIVISAAEFVDVNANCSGNHGSHEPDERPVLQVGSPSKPIPADITARIRLIDFDDIDDNCGPGIINYGGRMDFHGAPMKHTWLKLSVTANQGEFELTVTDEVSWKPGDRIIITGTVRNDSFKSDGDTFRNSGDAQTEENFVASVSGSKITLTQPLIHTHKGDGDFRAEVANLSRNVVIESRDPNGVRGHTMYHHNSRGSISYAEFAHLGKNGVLARYPIHYHVLGSSNRGSSVIGASIWDSHNRWITIHGTNYLVVRDCVGYQSLGHGYFMEDASEVYNLLDHNLAVHGYNHEKLPNQALDYDENAGAGFWWANGRNALIGNVAAECDRYGFQFDVPEEVRATVEQPDGMRKSDVQVNRLAFIAFKNNEAHGMRMYGFWGNGDTTPNDPFLIENYRCWQLRYAISANGRNSFLNTLDFWEVDYGFYGSDPFDAKLMNINGNAVHEFIVDFYERPQGLITVENMSGDDLGEYPLRITGKKQRDLPCDVHIRNFTLTNVEDNLYGAGSEGSNAKSTPELTMYLHDFFGPDRDAKIIPAMQSRNDGLNYQELSPIFRSNVKVAEVNVPFPENPIKPVDILPPATVMTYPPADAFVSLESGRSLTVRGTCIDASSIASLTVNGQEVTPLAENYTQWEINLFDLSSGEISLVAQATDEFGNKELNPHTLKIRIDTSTAVHENDLQNPAIDGFKLHANYPNPFNPQTMISFSIPRLKSGETRVQLHVYDAMSRRIVTLIDSSLPTGDFSTAWSGRDATGAAQASGVYFYELIAIAANGQELFRQTKKMMLVR